MNYDSIVNSPHRAKIDRYIELGWSPSIIHEALKREEITEFQLDVLNDYVKNYYQTVLSTAFEERNASYPEVANSMPSLMLDTLDDASKRFSYLTILELDLLRAEKMTQDLMRGIAPSISVKTFSELAKLKSNLVTNAVTLLDYKKAIQNAQEAQFNSTRIDMSRLTPYLSSLNDDDRSIALDALNLILESRTEEVQQYLPD